MPPAQGIGGAMPTAAAAGAGSTTAATPTILPRPPPLTVAHNASHLHPVFFTTKLRRPAFTLQTTPSAPWPSAGFNPVAHGYLYQDARRPGDKVAGPRL